MLVHKKVLNRKACCVFTKIKGLHLIACIRFELGHCCYFVALCVVYCLTISSLVALFHSTNTQVNTLTECNYVVLFQYHCGQADETDHRQDRNE